ncbi:MAG: aminopeptidase, partial [Phycisphaeraceae bacterium]|nr:aminopeptidase [Phycisphaeraceae bacterium]
MRDPRLDRLAHVLVHYATGVKAGELVRISGDPIATDALEAIYEAVLEVGAHPVVRSTPDACGDRLLEIGNDDQLDYVDPLARHEIETIDVSIGLWAETNTRSRTRMDPARIARRSAARRPIMETFMKRAADGDLRWCGTLFPTAASAQDAEMSLRQYEEFVFAAGHLDADDPVARWQEIQTRQQKVVDWLNGKKELRFLADNGTDLTVNVDGMTWINCCGHENFPDGEVFTGPNLDAGDGGVNGVVRYHFPAVYQGREVHDIELTFEGGRVVEAKASKGEAFLHEMLDQDDGA